MKAMAIREYGEGRPVEIVRRDGNPGKKRWVVRAANQGGFDCTEVDILDLLAYLKEERPGLLVESGLKFA
jgi:hypothetical protein